MGGEPGKCLVRESWATAGSRVRRRGENASVSDCTGAWARARAQMGRAEVMLEWAEGEGGEEVTLKRFALERGGIWSRGTSWMGAWSERKALLRPWDVLMC